MLLLKQLDLFDARFGGQRSVVATANPAMTEHCPPPARERDYRLEVLSAQLLRAAGATQIADTIRVVWSSRLRSAAGRADFRSLLVTLNPRLHDHGDEEIDRTLKHELAHLLAQARAGRRRIQPHGPEWRTACADLGISGEARCHRLPFPVNRREPRYIYRCPCCGRDFPRVRRIRRAIACLGCCRRLNRGRFDKRAQLRLVTGLNLT
jgi:SprT protein